MNPSFWALDLYFQHGMPGERTSGTFYRTAYFLDRTARTRAKAAWEAHGYRAQEISEPVSVHEDHYYPLDSSAKT